MNAQSKAKPSKGRLVSRVAFRFVKPLVRQVYYGTKYGLTAFREVWGIEASRRLDGRSLQTFGQSKVEITDGYSFGILRWHIIQRRCYDFETENATPYVLDCGSNIGLSILRFKEQHPDAVVIGFEPDPRIFPILERNIERNHCTDVKLIQAALAGLDGPVRLVSDGKRLSFLETATQRVPHGWSTFEVPAVTLAGYVDREVDFLKMNIEGAERDVLLGLGAKVQRIKQMVFEYHHQQDSPQTLGEILEFLSTHGFEYVIHSYALFTNPHAHPPFKARNNNYTLAVYAHRAQFEKTDPLLSERKTGEGQALASRLHPRGNQRALK